MEKPLVLSHVLLFLMSRLMLARHTYVKIQCIIIGFVI